MPCTCIPELMKWRASSPSPRPRVESSIRHRDRLPDVREFRTQRLPCQQRTPHRQPLFQNGQPELDRIVEEPAVKAPLQRLSQEPQQPPQSSRMRPPLSSVDLPVEQEVRNAPLEFFQ